MPRLGLPAVALFAGFGAGAGLAPGSPQSARTALRRPGAAPDGARAAPGGFGFGTASRQHVATRQREQVRGREAEALAHPEGLGDGREPARAGDEVDQQRRRGAQVERAERRQRAGGRPVRARRRGGFTCQRSGHDLGPRCRRREGEARARRFMAVAAVPRGEPLRPDPNPRAVVGDPDRRTSRSLRRSPAPLRAAAAREGGAFAAGRLVAWMSGCPKLDFAAFIARAS